MKSTILLKDQQALIRLHKTMTPAQRLVAFLNHSRLIARLHQAGKATRKRALPLKARSKIISIK